MVTRTSPRSTSRIGGADLKFDHLGHLVADLARAASRLGRGGFPLTDRVGLSGPDGTWSGGDQQVAGLPDGYIEIQQLVERGHGHVLESRADRVPAVAVLAWMSMDLGADIEVLRDAGVPLSDPAGWSRRTAGGLARFRFAAVQDDAGPIRVIVQHHDPHLTRRPVMTRNGIVRVAGLRREGDEQVTPVDASGLEDAVRLLLEARTVTSIMFDCESRESLTYLEASDWTIAGARCHSRDDLGADLELRWPA
jgi:hypothetical protein